MENKLQPWYLRSKEISEIRYEFICNIQRAKHHGVFSFTNEKNSIFVSSLGTRLLEEPGVSIALSNPMLLR
jgi:uncharacterized protein YigA (DUF484 family)